jgi:hypothetical protein
VKEMALQVYKVNLTGYVIRNTDIMDDPNHLELSTVMEIVLDNQHECTIDLLDSIGDTGCDCTECTCGAKTESVPLMMNLEEPGTSADSTVEDF